MLRHSAGQVIAGPISITWSKAIQFPIAIQHRRLNGLAYYVTLCPIQFQRGNKSMLVPQGYEFDGASIPSILWWIPGFSPIGLHLWAALAHDWICDHPDELDRVIGDAIFVSLLKHTEVPWYRRIPMYAAVRIWSIYRGIKALFSRENVP